MKLIILLVTGGPLLVAMSLFFSRSTSDALSSFEKILETAKSRYPQIQKKLGSIKVVRQSVKRKQLVDALHVGGGKIKEYAAIEKAVFLGWKVEEIPPGGIYDLLGIRAGDLILVTNGEDEVRFIRKKSLEPKTIVFPAGDVIYLPQDRRIIPQALHPRFENIGIYTNDSVEFLVERDSAYLRIVTEIE